MQFTKFGHTGLNVSRLCLGTATFGKQSDEETSFAILDRASEAGVNFLDTADVYPMGGDAASAGRTEEILGRWLKGKRARFIVATKGGAPMGPSPWDQGASRKHLLDAIDGSLRRLGTDYVDLYQLHLDDRRRRSTRASKRSTRSFAPARLATSASRTSSPTASRVRSGARTCCGSLSLPRSNLATVCSSARSSESYCRWRS